MRSPELFQEAFFLNCRSLAGHFLPVGSPLPFSTAYCLSCLLSQRPLHTLLRTLQVTAGTVSTVPLIEGSAEARPTPSPSGSLQALDPYQELPLHLAYPQFLSTCKQGPHLSATTRIRLCIKVKSPQVLLPLGWVGALADAVWTNALELLSRVSESTVQPLPTHPLPWLSGCLIQPLPWHAWKFGRC